MNIRRDNPRSSATITNNDDVGGENETENYRRNDIATRETDNSTEFLIKYRDRVYNIRNFLHHHPGGRNTLERYKDRVLDETLAKYSHSKSAYHLLEEFAVQQQEKYDGCEDLIDWNAPILQQVGLMGDRYWEWVNLPVNRPIRFFQSDILETLSVTPWYVLPIFWLPMATYFFYVGCSSHTAINIAVTLQNILPSFVLGVFIWTVVEYFVHKKIFHFKPPHNSKLLITLHFLFHGNHHKAPLDGRRLVIPPILGAIVAAIVWKAYKAMFPLTIAPFVAVGTIMGYLCYDLMHYYLHYGAPKAGSYLYTMKRRHNYHHFVYHDQGFGVTSELWDRLLNTDLIMRNLKEPLEW
ncbi:fatty acid 2-hydroxylase [Pseudomyrmex gracilis]|uniref:fatty acid 2-hydroxylase n=1 Tax=Pseudomyrmex gracilis TaxID=219809 RepID=UPI0009954A4D|nr:fatty acid 2-hydroxylase [Pseudomyrmex gracilis]